MQHLDIMQWTETPLGEISKGEQRMVFIARALVKRPELLIMDEPCQGLDAGKRDRVLQTIDSIAARLDSGVVYVTHYSRALPKSIKHVLALDRGRIVDKALWGPGQTQHKY